MLLVFVALLASAGMWLSTRSWFLVSRIGPILEDRLGGIVTVDEARYMGKGELSLHGITLTSPGYDGTAGEVMTIDRAVVVLDMRALLRRKVEVLGLELGRVHVRLSEDARHSGRFSFMALKPQWESAEGGPALPPYVTIRRALIEVGLHYRDSYSVVGQRWFRGGMSPLEGDEGWLGFALTEIDPATWGVLPGGLALDGQWNVLTNEHRSRIEGLELNERTAQMCPALARLLWDQMEPAGRLYEASIGWNPRDQLTLDFDVENVGLTLPVRTEAFWAQYSDGEVRSSDDRPRMHVTSGRIRLRGMTLELQDLIGEVSGAAAEDDIVAVPYAVSLRMELPEPDWDDSDEWLEDVLQKAPFEMLVALEEFRVDRLPDGRAATVELPMVVARFLEKFAISEWQLTTQLSLGRSVLGGPIETHGTADIRQATGAFSHFPYRLDAIDADIAFDRNTITVKRLAALGSAGAPINITGSIVNPGIDATVDLELTARDAPLDDRFRNALGERHRKVYDALLHGPSAESLGAAGVLADDATLEAARAAFEETTEELAGLANASTPAALEERDRLERRRTQLDRIIAAGAFAPGGLVDLDLVIHRSARQRKPIITGQIVAQRVGLLYERFPYPITVMDAELNWHENGIDIVTDGHRAGATIVTPGGGGGIATGGLTLERLEDGEARMSASIELSVAEDQMNVALLAAIPLSDTDRGRLGPDEVWPGEGRSIGARILEGLDLNGSLTYHGTINTMADGKAEFSFRMDMQDGVATPTVALPQALGLPDAGWPDTWTFEDVIGFMEFTNRGVTVRDLRGRRGPTEIRANGRILFEEVGLDSDLTVAFDNIELEAHLLEMLPGDRRETARALWERYEPQGHFDAQLTYRAIGGVATPMEFRITPGRFSVRMDDRPVTFKRATGAMIIKRQLVDLEKLAFDVEQFDGEDARLEVHGRYGTIDGVDDRLVADGRWLNGSFESPMLAEILGRANRPGTLAQYRATRPTGGFDADFSYDSAGGDDRYRVDLRPRSLSFHVDDTIVSARLEQNARCVLKPREVTLDSMNGSLSCGDFQLDGTIRLRDTTEVDLTFGYDGALRADPLLALLPDQARTALETIDYQDPEPTQLRDARLHLESLPDDGDPATPLQYRTDFTGTFLTKDAAFDGGTRFEDVTGAFDIVIRQAPGIAAELEVLARDVDCTVLGQPLRDTEARITYDAAGAAVRIEDLSGDVNGGVFAVDASIGLGENLDYDIVVNVAGAALSAATLVGHLEADDASVETIERDPDEAECYAGLTLGGRRGEPAARSGRGMVRVMGEISSVPLALKMLQIPHLSLPTVTTLDYSDADFFITGNRLTFERILFEAAVGDTAPLQLLGRGGMDLDTFELDTRFNSRGGWLLLRDVVGGIGDQLGEIEVTGPITDPKARFIPFPGFSRDDEDDSARLSVVSDRP